MIRIVRASTLKALQEAMATEQAKRREAVATMAAYQKRLGGVRGERDGLRGEVETVRQQARDWECRYNATVDSIATWVNEVRTAIQHPQTGSQFRADVAIGLWKAWIERAEQAGEADDFSVMLIKTLLGLDVDEATQRREISNPEEAS